MDSVTGGVCCGDSRARGPFRGEVQGRPSNGGRQRRQHGPRHGIARRFDLRQAGEGRRASLAPGKADGPGAVAYAHARRPPARCCGAASQAATVRWVSSAVLLAYARRLRGLRDGVYVGGDVPDRRGHTPLGRRAGRSVLLAPHCASIYKSLFVCSGERLPNSHALTAIRRHRACHGRLDLHRCPGQGCECEWTPYKSRNEGIRTDVRAVTHTGPSQAHSGSQPLTVAHSHSRAPT
jgi:hypothetical protein